MKLFKLWTTKRDTIFKRWSSNQEKVSVWKDNNSYPKNKLLILRTIHWNLDRIQILPKLGQHLLNYTKKGLNISSNILSVAPKANPVQTIHQTKIIINHQQTTLKHLKPTPTQSWTLNSLQIKMDRMRWIPPLQLKLVPLMVKTNTSEQLGTMPWWWINLQGGISSQQPR